MLLAQRARQCHFVSRTACHHLVVLVDGDGSRRRDQRRSNFNIPQGIDQLTVQAIWQSSLIDMAEELGYYVLPMDGYEKWIQFAESIPDVL